MIATVKACVGREDDGTSLYLARRGGLPIVITAQAKGIGETDLSGAVLPSEFLKDTRKTRGGMKVFDLVSEPSAVSKAISNIRAGIRTISSRTPSIETNRVSFPDHKRLPADREQLLGYIAAFEREVSRPAENGYLVVPEYGAENSFLPREISERIKQQKATAKGFGDKFGYPFASSMSDGTRYVRLLGAGEPVLQTLMRTCKFGESLIVFPRALTSASWFRRFVDAHEVGHMVARVANGGKFSMTTQEDERYADAFATIYTGLCGAPKELPQTISALRGLWTIFSGEDDYNTGSAIEAALKHLALTSGETGLPASWVSEKAKDSSEVSQGQEVASVALIRQEILRNWVALEGPEQTISALADIIAMAANSLPLRHQAWAHSLAGNLRDTLFAQGDLLYAEKAETAIRCGSELAHSDAAVMAGENATVQGLAGTRAAISGWLEYAVKAPNCEAYKATVSAWAEALRRLESFVATDAHRPQTVRPAGLIRTTVTQTRETAAELLGDKSGEGEWFALVKRLSAELGNINPTEKQTVSRRLQGLAASVVLGRFGSECCEAHLPERLVKALGGIASGDGSAILRSKRLMPSLEIKTMKAAIVAGTDEFRDV